MAFCFGCKVVASAANLTGKGDRRQPRAQPAAANMRKLRWSTELVQGGTLRGSGDTGWGELVMSGSYGRHSEDQVKAAAVSSAQNWYSEVNKPGFDRKSVDRYVFNMGTAHCTQLVWADTE